MIISTLAAATLAAAQPQSAPPAPAMNHSKMDHSKMRADAKPGAKMDCCKDGCSCCGKMKDKPAS